MRPWQSLFVLLAAVFPACGPEGDTVATGGGGASVANTGGSGGDDCGFGCGGTPQLSVVPATATIEVVDGVVTAFDFEAELDGQPVEPSWQIDLSSVAGVDATGVVSPTGNVGGLVTLKAEYDGNAASAAVTVKITRTSNLAGLSQADIDLLKSPSGGQDPSLVWAYPYDRTVFPKGILPPELMWNGSGAGDKYWIHLESAFAQLDIFTLVEPPSRHALDPALWTLLTESGGGGAVDFTVNRLATGSAAATTVIDHEWTVANGSLRGTVYYWANNVGRVMRIQPGAGAPEDFLAGAGVTECNACHAVSANGSTLILGGDSATSTFNLLTNTSTFSLTSVGKPVRQWGVPAISPDGTTLIENNGANPGFPVEVGLADGMWDTATGARIAGSGLDGVLLDDPAFSPDGSRIAYVDHATLALGVYAWDPVTKLASNPTPLVEAGADPALNAIAYPSVSPSAEWIAYHRGRYPDSKDTRFGPGALYLASADQPGTDTRMRAANGDDYPFAAGDRDRNYNYEPTFAPVSSGGYAWVVFTSRRTYGNRLTGPSTEVKQLWVAAIDQDPQPGEDPSHPAFRVPGQDMATLNMRGFWALEPCKQVGDSCSNGSQCCNGNCDGGICDEPEGCAQTGNACAEDADCCDAAASCINGFCSEPPPR